MERNINFVTTHEWRASSPKTSMWFGLMQTNSNRPWQEGQGHPFEVARCFLMICIAHAHIKVCAQLWALRTPQAFWVVGIMYKVSRSVCNRGSQTSSFQVSTSKQDAKLYKSPKWTWCFSLETLTVGSQLSEPIILIILLWAHIVQPCYNSSMFDVQVLSSTRTQYVGVRRANRNVPVELNITIKARFFKLIRLCTINKGEAWTEFWHVDWGHLAWISSRLHCKLGEDFLSYTSTI